MEFPFVACSVVVVAVTSAGCSYQLFSPPARMVYLESARTAAPGETVVGVKGGKYAAIFDPGVEVGSTVARHGVADGIEVDVDATWARLVEESNPGIDRNIYAARLGVKASNAGGRKALLAGVGGGFAPAAGNFAAVDLGGVLSYPNCYVLPFAGGSAFVSVPFAARRVYFSDGAGSASDTANTTYGLGFSTGLEIPLDRGRCRRGRTPARIQIGLGHARLWRSDGQVTTTRASDGGTITTTRGGGYDVFGLAAGLEFPF